MEEAVGVLCESVQEQIGSAQLPLAKILPQISGLAGPLLDSQKSIVDRIGEREEVKYFTASVYACAPLV